MASNLTQDEAIGMVEHALDALPPGPWSLAPLKGKYYGTVVLDAEGNSVCDIWMMGDGTPSPREAVQPGDEDYEGYYCDSHYESMASYQTAMLIVKARNG